MTAPADPELSEDLDLGVDTVADLDAESITGGRRNGSQCSYEASGCIH